MTAVIISMVKSNAAATNAANHMAKPKSSNSNTHAAFGTPSQRPNWLVAILCLFVGIMLGVALAFYAPEQSRKITTNPTALNPVGFIGAETSWRCLYLLGLSTWIIPLFLIWTTYIALRHSRGLSILRVIAMVFGVVTFSGLAAMVDSSATDYFTQGLGGVLGTQLYNNLLHDTFGPFGSGLLLGSLYTACLCLIFTKDIGAAFENFVASFNHWRENAAKRRAERAEFKRQLKEAKQRQSLSGPPQSVLPPVQRKLTVASRTVAPFANAADTPTSATPTKIDATPATPTRPATVSETILPTRASTRPPLATESATATDTKSLAANATGKFELNIVKPEELKKAAKPALPQSNDAAYQFPPISILREPAGPTAANSEEEHRRNAENLLRILSEFGVEVTLGEIHVGPVITRYEVIPAAGVRVEKIAGLDKNIALGMRAQSVRILAPIPGKAAVGVEVPNQHPTPVGMRELLEAEDWAGAKAEIPIALGKDVSGQPLISDLAKMPHLLIAGATGSGKSVCINAIVASILYSKSPRDLRLIMVDPKIVELKIFNTLPHMLIPVVTEAKKVPAALKWLLGEMEQRYKIFAKVGARNILGFNNRKKIPPTDAPAVDAQTDLPGVDDDEIEIPERLPYIVAIIDELADLMMVAPAEIETSIARLAQLARAAGIHLIIATQRPSVNVITGVIKANLPSRIAFQVASQVDSRTILDTKGADTLIGRGDMLFSPPGTSRLVRAQGAFVSDEEIQELVNFLKRNGPPQYAQHVQAQIDRDPEADDEEDEDPLGEDGSDDYLLRKSIEVLKNTRRASTSMLQRRLKIGYNRAARIMELMEEKGIVGPENGSSPREILADLDSL